MVGRLHLFYSLLSHPRDGYSADLLVVNCLAPSFHQRRIRATLEGFLEGSHFNSRRRLFCQAQRQNDVDLNVPMSPAKSESESSNIALTDLMPQSGPKAKHLFLITGFNRQRASFLVAGFEWWNNFVMSISTEVQVHCTFSVLQHIVESNVTPCVDGHRVALSDEPVQSTLLNAVFD